MTGNAYEPQDYPPFAVTVDIVLMTVVDRELRVLLIQRGEPPYQGDWALPGGFVLPEESLDDAAARELLEETGIHRDQTHMEQLGAYGDPGRDPRMRVVTAAYWATAARLADAPRAGGDAAHAEMIPLAELRAGRVNPAFDHRRIVDDAVDRLRSGLETTTVAHRFCPPEFTTRELQDVYEAVWGVELDAGNFYRDMTHRKGFLIPSEGRTPSGERGGRPARLWKAGISYKLNRPFFRSSGRAGREKREDDGNKEG